MNLRKQALYFIMPAVLAAALTGCFSYHRTVEKTTTPTATVPSASSETTTTTTNDDGTVERRSTTTYANP